MFNLVQTQQGLYAIQDTSDGSFDIVTYEEILKFSKVGIEIGGVHPNADNTAFEVSYEYFIDMSDDDEEDDEISEDDDYKYEESEYEEDEGTSEYEDYEDYEESEYEDSEDEDNTEDTEDTEEDDYEDIEDDLQHEHDDDCDCIVDYDAADDYESDYDTETGVAKLYGLFTVYDENGNPTLTKEGNLLQRYYLATSQMLFKDAQASGLLAVQTTTQHKAEKQVKLEEMRQKGDTWIYAGFFDALSRDSGYYCAFGHPLRFVHFALDASANGVTDALDINAGFWGIDYESIDWEKIDALEKRGSIIKFGIDCIGDFFNVPPEKLKEIKRMQVEAQEELTWMFHVYNDDETYANVMASFREFEAIADSVALEVTKDRLMQNPNPVIPYAFVQLYKEFKSSRLIYPRSLVKRFQTAVAHYNTRGSRKVFNHVSDDYRMKTFRYLCSRQKCYDEFCRFEEIRKTSPGLVSGSTFFSKYIENLCIVQMAGIYTYSPYSPLACDKREGGNNKNSRQAFYDLTGFKERDAKYITDIVEGNYALGDIPYTYIYRQLSGTDLAYRDAEGIEWVEWNADYIKKLLEYLEVRKEVTDYITNIGSDLKLPKLVKHSKVSESMVIEGTANIDDINNAVFYTVANESTGTNGFATGFDAILELSRYDSQIDKKTNIRLGKYVIGKKNVIYNETTFNSLDEVIADIRSKKDNLVILLNDLVQKYNEGINKRCEEKNEDERKRLTEVYANKLMKDKEANESTQKTVSQTATTPAQEQDVNEPINSVGISSELAPNEASIYEACKAKVISNGIINCNFTKDEVLACLTYAEKTPELKAKFTANDKIVLDILGTVTSRKMKPTDKQMYWLNKGMVTILGEFDTTGKDLPKTPEVIRIEVDKDAHLKDILRKLTPRCGELKALMRGSEFFNICTIVNNANKYGTITEKDAEKIDKARQLLKIT